MQFTCNNVDFHPYNDVMLRRGTSGFLSNEPVGLGTHYFFTCTSHVREIGHSWCDFL